MKKISWHRLFGLLLTDYLTPRGFNVEVEKDLSFKRQLLDVVVVEQVAGKGNLEGICDGFDNFVAHNLITYKSKHESMTGWSIEELIGHYVNYRKIAGIKAVKSEDIGLYAISTETPEKLFKTVSVREIYQGVYSFRPIYQEVRIIVLNELPLLQRNAALAFFSFNAEKVGFALNNYRWNYEDGSTAINKLFETYGLEGINMSYTWADFRRDYINECIEEIGFDEFCRQVKIEERLKELKPEDRLKGLKPEDRLKGLKPEDVLKWMKPEDRLKGLKPEDRLKGLKTEALLKGLKTEEIERYLKKIKRKTRNNPVS